MPNGSHSWQVCGSVEIRYPSILYIIIEVLFKIFIFLIKTVFLLSNM